MSNGFAARLRDARAILLVMTILAVPIRVSAQQPAGERASTQAHDLPDQVTWEELRAACDNASGSSDPATRIRDFCDLGVPSSENLEAWRATGVPSAQSIREWAGTRAPAAMPDSIAAAEPPSLPAKKLFLFPPSTFATVGAGAAMGLGQIQTIAILGATDFITAQAGSIISHYATTRFGHQLCDARIAVHRAQAPMANSAPIQLQGAPRDAAATASSTTGAKDRDRDEKGVPSRGIYLYQLTPSACRLMLGEPNEETGRYENAAAITLPSVPALRSALRRDLAALPDALVDHYTRRGVELYRDAWQDQRLGRSAERVVLLTAAARMARSYQAERDPIAALKAAEAALVSMTRTDTADAGTYAQFPLLRDLTIGVATLNVFGAGVLEFREDDRETALLMGVKLLLVNAQQHTGQNQRGIWAALAQRFPNPARQGQAASDLPSFDAASLWTRTQPAVKALMRAHEQATRMGEARADSAGGAVRAYAAALPELLRLLAYVVEPDTHGAARATQMLEVWTRIPMAVLEERYIDAVVEATSLASMIGGAEFENAALPRSAARTLHFAAEIVYAKEPAEVEAAIRRVAAPVDAYTRKRDGSSGGRRGYVTVNAYVGGAAGLEQTRDGGDWRHSATSGGLWVPLGVEVGLTRGWLPAGLFFQLLDLGQVAAWRFAASDDTVKADPPPFTAGHVFSPGVFLIGHLRQAPISFGAGASYAPRFRELGRMSEDGATTPARADALRFSLLVGVDVPILPR